MYHALIFNVEYRSLSRNLGPYRIAHWLRANDWDAEVIDYALHWQLEELIEFTNSRVTNNTKFIGFSNLFGEWNEVIFQYVFWLKQKYPNIKIISGSSSLPKVKINVDYHIWGFGEYALDALLKYLFSNGTSPKYTEISEIRVIDGSDYPAYPLTDYSVSYQKRDFIQPWEFLSIETARGCRFKCSFCSFSVLGVKEDHSTSAESFEKQLKDNYYNWGVENYVIAEETFNDRTDKIKKFSKVVDTLDFKPWFSAFIRFDLLLSRKDDRHLLEDMNVLGQFYGIESFNHATAKLLRKGMSSDKIKEGLLEIKEHYSHTKKYRGTTSFIIGAPLETQESILSTSKWLKENWSDQSVGFYPMSIPLKGRKSDLSRDYEKNGYEKIDINDLKKKHIIDMELHNDIVNKIDAIHTDGESLLWKNSNMDIYEAFKLHKIYGNMVKDHNFKKTTFALAEFSGVESTLDDKLTHSANDVHKWQPDEWAWYDKYKNMKLISF